MKVRTPYGREFEVGRLTDAYRNLPDVIIADLAALCFAGEATFDPDPRVDARQQGRRDVWLHINRFLGLDQSQIEGLYRGRAVILMDEPQDG